MTDETLCDRYARHLLAAGLPPEVVIGELLADDMLDRLKSITRIRPAGHGSRLLDPGADDAGVIWLRAEIVAAVLTAMRCRHSLDAAQVREEVERAMAMALAHMERP